MSRNPKIILLIQEVAFFSSKFDMSLLLNTAVFFSQTSRCLFLKQNKPAHAYANGLVLELGRRI